jgi:hypothetical protein
MFKRCIVFFCCTLTTFIGFAQLSNSSKSKKERQLWQRVEALHRAIFEAKDSIALKDLVSAKVTYGHSGGAVEDKALMIQKAVASPTNYKNISQEKISLTFIKKTAIARIILRATSIEKSVESPLDLSILQLWVKEKGTWKIAARQAVKIAPKKV